jgi:hypothetical protein
MEEEGLILGIYRKERPGNPEPAVINSPYF